VHVTPPLNLEKAGYHDVLTAELLTADGTHTDYVRRGRITVGAAVDIHHPVLRTGIENRLYPFFLFQGAAAEGTVLKTAFYPGAPRFLLRGLLGPGPVDDQQQNQGGQAG
jgi:hypothetical protein